MSWYMVDVETDGPCPGLYSMIALGAVIVEPGEARSFGAKLRPLEGASCVFEALAVSGATHEQTLAYPPALHGTVAFAAWIEKTNVGKRAMFISDNNGFDWQFVNYYFHKFLARNPFGHSSTNLGSLYKGLVRDGTKNFKHLRRTKHTHDPVDDARGNVEALLHMCEKMGLVFPL